MSNSKANINPGDLIGWIQGGKPAWGVCELVDDKLVVQQDGRQRRLRPADVSVVTDGTLADVTTIKQRADAADINEFWEQVAGLAGQEMTVSALVAASGLDERSDAGWVWLLIWEYPEYFGRVGRTRFVVRGEQELAEAQARAAARRAADEVRQRLTQDAARVKDGEWDLAEWASRDDAVRDAIRSVTLSFEDPELAPAIQVVGPLLRACYNDAGIRWPIGYFAASLLSDKDPWLSGNALVNDHRAFLDRFQPSEPFAVAEPVPTTGLVAVDDEGTDERDDAIGLNRLSSTTGRLEVAVADLSVLLDRDDGVAQAALKIGSTLYLPTGRVPMLPPSIGIGQFSLDPGKARNAFVMEFAVDLDADQPARLVGFRRGAVTVDAARTYDQVDQQVRDQNPDWLFLDKLARRLTEAREANGAMETDIQDAMVEVQNGHPGGLVTMKSGEGARRIVKEAMILANSAAGQLLADAKAAAPFRVQEDADDPRAPAHVKLQPGPHYGLGVNHYVFMTSPIRRFTDIIVQRQLRGIADGDVLSSNEVSQLVSTADAGLNEVRRWSQAAAKYWKLRYLEAHPDTALSVQAIEPGPPGSERVRVHIRPIGLRDLMVRRHGAAPGSPIELVSVDSERGAIEFRWG